MARAGRNWWKSAGVRFGLIYTIIFGLSAFAMVGFLWWSTAGLLDRQTDGDIESDAENLTEAFDLGGPRALVMAIRRRINNNVDDDAIYLLTDSAMKPLAGAGNLEFWPSKIGPTDQWSELRIDRGGLIVPARVRQYVLQEDPRDPADDLHLLIGRDIRIRGHIQRLVTGALPWTLVIMVGLGILGAATVRRLFGAMLADVSQTAAAITAGDLARRVPITGRGDEFDGLAETINDMLDRIGRLMDGVRQVSNAIAHDLRTPIARARARLEDAAREGATEADLRAAVERAIIDLDGLIKVFQALLRIAEIEAGARRSAFARVDLAPLLRDLAELYEAAAEEGGQHLVLELPDQLITFGDRDMLQQAVANLLDNALKFSPPGGTVRVAGVLPATIVVSDQGPGIPACDRERATERFFRGETARHAPGSGLGLALVQAVATLHGGALRLQDNEPGLRASIVLPAANATRMEELSRSPQLVAIPSGA